MLTHIHLDHAGAAGVLCRRFPGLVVYVHESGAPHLADPTKLLRAPSASTAMTWSGSGAEMRRCRRSASGR